MFKKSFALLLVLALVLSVFVGCAKAPAPEEQGTETPEAPAPDQETAEVPQEFTYNYGADPETLDPNRASEEGGLTVLNHIMEGLVRMDENQQAEPGVAERWEVNEDATVWTFYLRDDAVWSDGEPITADQFAYSWKRALDPATGADYAYQLYYIKNAQAYNNGEASADDLGIEVIDDKTIKVTLEGPTGWMDQIFAFVTMFPVRQDLVEKYGDTFGVDADTIVSNGPFKLESWSHSEEIVMVPNENYWNRDIVKLDKFTMTLINEASTALAAYEAGDIDGAYDIPTAEIPRLLTEEPGFMILPDLSLYYYTLNNDVEPLNDIRVRKALAYAIDRRALIDTVLQGGQAPATGVVPYGINYGGEDFREVGGNYGIEEYAQVEKAQELLAEAGFPNGEGFPDITLKYNTNEGNKIIAEAIQEMWKQNLNVNIELSNQEWKVHLVELEEGNYQIGRIGWGADYIHPMTFIDLFLSDSGNNYSNWGSDEFDKLVEQAKVETDPAKVNELMHKAEDIWMNNMTVIPIYYKTDPELIKPYVKGWRKNAMGNLYVEKAYIEAH